MPAVTGVVLDGVAPDQAGTASAVFNTFRQLGGAVAIAVFGSLIAASKTFLPGVRASLAIAAVLLLLTALISRQVRSRPATP
jgi:DHA2 family methylenomycin A resistance protein-like MFS transporter